MPNGTASSGKLLVNDRDMVRLADSLRLALNIEDKFTFPDGFIKALNEAPLWKNKDKNWKYEAYRPIFNTVSLYGNSENNLIFIYDKVFTYWAAQNLQFKNNSTIEEIYFPVCNTIQLTSSASYLIQNCNNLRVISFPILSQFNSASMSGGLIDCPFTMEIINVPYSAVSLNFPNVLYSDLKFYNGYEHLGSSLSTVFPNIENYQVNTSEIYNYSYTFAHCSKLKEVTFTNMELPSYCFSNCSTLKKVTLGSAQTISYTTFDNCLKLSEIYLTGSNIYTLEATPSETFPNISKVYVPASLVSSYKVATNWTTISSLIYPIPSE